jgi:hypothetical protein
MPALATITFERPSPAPSQGRQSQKPLCRARQLGANDADEPGEVFGPYRKLLDGFGPDHILWGTDTPVIGPPHWQIEAFQTFTMPEELVGGRTYSQLTPAVKNKIFGENAARIVGIAGLSRRGGLDQPAFSSPASRSSGCACRGTSR